MAPHTLTGSSRREESDDYAEIVARLNSKLRVIRSAGAPIGVSAELAG
jgi:hypothetical protein